jgi:hypothetical protein
MLTLSGRLVFSKSTHIEIYIVHEAEQLELVYDCDINGRIAYIDVFSPKVMIKPHLVSFFLHTIR